LKRILYICVCVLFDSCIISLHTRARARAHTHTHTHARTHAHIFVLNCYKYIMYIALFC